MRARLRYSNAEVHWYVREVGRLYREKWRMRIGAEVLARNKLEGGSVP